MPSTAWYCSMPTGVLWLASACLSVIAAHSTIPIEVQLKYGKIRGRESIFLGTPVRSYLSVPFAEPPVGDLRFRPPLPKRPWNGTVEATALAPACFQGRDTYNSSFWGSEMWNANTPIQEDCLYLNIWAPANARNLTVMVWLFGGGFYSGSPSLILYDGRALATQTNVVVVNINYRLGPFGYIYFDHEDAPGNMGMLDQQLAFHWIRENIANFGGNPSSISLFGESAGASSIVAHLIAPGSRGMFHNGILQSGSLDNKWSLDTPSRALEKSMILADKVQCNRTTIQSTINCLKECTPEQLIDQMWSLGLQFLEFPFAIVSRDRNFFREFDAFTALRKRQYRRDINLMIGINHDEGNFWNIYNLAEYFDKPSQPVLSLEDFYACGNRAFAALPEVIRNAANFVYLNGTSCPIESPASPTYADLINQMVGDFFFTCDSIWLAEQMDDAPGKVFIYYFDHPSSANPWPKWTGTMHGYEIEFVFGVPTYNATANYTSRERTLSQKIMQYWSTFAKTGIPRLNKNKNNIGWPEYGASSRYWMHLKGGSHIKSIPARKQRECAVWRASRDLEYNEYLLSSAPAMKQSLPLLLISTALALGLR